MRVSRLILAVAICAIAVPAFGQSLNDDCVNAEIATFGTVYTGNVSLDTSDGVSSCGTTAGNPDVWYSFTAPNDGLFIFSTCGTHDGPGVDLGMDTVIAAFDACGGLELACDDDAGPPPCPGTDTGILRDSVVSLNMLTGETVLIRISHFGGVIAGGDYTFLVEGQETLCFDGLDDDGDGLVDCADPDCATQCVETGNCTDGIDNDMDGDVDCLDVDCAADLACLPVAPNDECINAEAVAEGVHPYDNTNTPVTGPIDCDANMTTDVWFLYTATSDGGARFSTCDTGTLLDTTLIVYDAALGCPLPGDPGLACDDDTCAPLTGGDAFLSEVEIPVFAGNQYYVQVGGWNGSTGTGNLTIESIEGLCFDGLDDDGDGLVDCADPDCAVQCDESQNCADGIDNDGNGDIDCLDVACAGAAACDESQNCGDGIDNDLDTLVDCDDPDCIGIGFCNEALNCGDGIDNDGDTLTDCDDPDCLNVGPCNEALNCADGIDNDGNGDIDCLDAACALDIACVAVPVNDECTGAIAVAEGTFAFNNINTPITGPNDCDVNMTTDVWFLYTATNDGSAIINTCGSAGTLVDTTIIVYDAALGCPLPGDVGLACDDDTCAAAASPNNFNSSVTIPVFAGNSYYVQVGGWNGTTGDSELNIEFIESNCGDGIDEDVDGFTDCADADCAGDALCVFDPATAIACLDNGVDTVDASWIPALIGDSQNIYENGVLVSNEPMTTTSWSVAYAPGFVGLIEVCVETVFGQNNSAQACCTAGIGGPANDECVDAIPAAIGDTLFDNTVSTSNGPIDCDGNMTTDVWFEHTVATTGTLTISTCNTVGTLQDTTLIVYDGAAGCPLPGDLGLACDDDTCMGPGGVNAFLSEVNVPVTAGQVLLIQVGGWNGSEGDGTLTIEQDCGDIGVAGCTFDQGTGDVTVTWTDNVNATAGYEIFENGVMIGTAPVGASSFVVSGATPGINQYDVTWTCGLSAAPGTGSGCSVNVVAPIPAGTTDVIIHNEGIPDAGNPTGSLGDVNSGVALQTALNNVGGLSVFRLTSENFDLAGLDFTGVARVWLCLGSFPNDYRLTQGEGDLLATLNAAGTGIYLEAGDHWGFQHVVSNFDARDGHDDLVAIDGDDTFVAMDPVVGNTVADLTAFAPGTAYNQDASAAGANDWTDQLALATLDAEVSLAEVMWTQSGGGFNTAIYAEHTTGAPSIIQSWEFGGFGGDQDALAAAYLNLVGGTVPPVGDQFIRANCNGDAAFNIADAIFLLGVLFPGPGGPNDPPCDVACDSNDDNGLNIADAIFMLGVLFPGPGGPPTLAEPTTCGVDPTPGALMCDMFPPCP